MYLSKLKTRKFSTYIVVVRCGTIKLMKIFMFLMQISINSPLILYDAHCDWYAVMLFVGIQEKIKKAA